MNAMLNLAQLVADERAMLRRNWGWFVGLGVLLTLLGVAGLIFVGALTVVTVIFVGWLFLLGGVLEVAHAVIRKGWQGFWLDLVSGLLTGLAGVFILLRPGEGATVLTMLLGVLFLVAGIFRVAAGVSSRNPYRGWFVVHGIVSILLAAMILADWPFSAVWVIGTLVAVDLIVNGLRLIVFGLAARNIPEIGGDHERTPAPAFPSS